MSLQQMSIKVLLCECSSQIKTFHRSDDATGDSTSCDEIVRRAASGNLEALGVLLYDVTKPLIEQRCPLDLQAQTEDLTQEVLLRMLHKFHHPNSPFIAQGFPAYRHYLNLTIKKSIRLMRLPDEHTSLESVIEPGIEYTTISQRDRDQLTVGGTDITQTIEDYETTGEILRHITNPIGREIIQRRYVNNESYDEIIAVLQLVDPSFNKKKAYKLAENSLTQLKKSFGVEQV